MTTNPCLRNMRRVLEPRHGFTVTQFVVTAVFIVAIIGVLIAFLMPARRVARHAARRTQCKNNLKHIALALQLYEEVNHALPPAYTVDADGKPLHSWRTLILPYLDLKTLYDKIDLTKPWDDPANAEVAKTPITIYRCPAAVCPPNHTTYVTVATSNSCLRPIDSRQMSEITDGATETLVVLELDAEQSVPWMAPRDANEALFLAITPNAKQAHEGGMHAAFLDGAVRFLDANFTVDQRRAMISIDGNEAPTFLTLP